MKRIHSAVLGALALTFAGAGFAAANPDDAMSGSSGSTAMGGNASAQAPDLSKDFKSTDLIGMNVSNRQNQQLGSISNLIVDQSGKVSYVVLNDTSGGTSGNKYIVPWNRVQLTPGQNVATLDVDRNALPSEFAAFDENMTAPVTGSPSSNQNAPGSSSGSMGSQPSTGGSMSTPPPSGGGAGGSSGGNY